MYSKKIPLKIYGDGNQTRDFVPIKNIIDTMYKISNLKFKKMI